MPSSFEGDGKPLSNTLVEGDGSLDVESMEKAAVWLRKKLGLTIIGFDIVVSVCIQSLVLFNSITPIPLVFNLTSFESHLLMCRPLQQSAF